MSERDVRSMVRLSAGALEDLALNLDAYALAAAIKLINAQIRAHGEGIPTSQDLTRMVNVPQRHKKAVREQLERLFDTRNGTWDYPEVCQEFAALKRKSETRSRAAKRRTSPKQASTTPAPDVSRAPRGEASGPTDHHRKTPADDAEPVPAEGIPSGVAVEQEEDATSASPEPPAKPSGHDHKQTQRPPEQPSLFEAYGQSEDTRSKADGAVNAPGATAQTPQAAASSGTDAPAEKSDQPTDTHATSEGAARTPGKTAPTSHATAGAGADAPMNAASLLKITYDRGIKILREAGQPDAKARRCLSMLLKDYDTAYVIKAIDVVEQRGGRVVEPFSYMRRILKNYPRLQDEQGGRLATRTPTAGDNGPGANGRPVEKPRPLATPETMGLSESLTQRIRDAAQPDDGYMLVKDEPTTTKTSRSSDKG